MQLISLLMIKSILANLIWKQKFLLEVIHGLAELGLCGLAVPEELGGLGLDYSLYSRVFAEVASHDGSIATMLGAHQSIGYLRLLNEAMPWSRKRSGSHSASGEKMAAFCLTEPGSGSDAYSIKTKAVKNLDGTYTITGQKILDYECSIS